jgi:diaminobutyrate-2-oxoglutarate transaminase
MTLGALSVTGNRVHRRSAGTPLGPTVMLPYAEGPRPFPDALQYIDALLDDPNSGIDLPAAFMLETVQGEGGIYVASPEFLVGLADIARRRNILLIVDDIQAGCGRTGGFFSFERAGIVPDVVCLSKSIGGNGSPMSLLLIRPEIDVWQPGDHTGTFRGNQLAFLAGAAAIDRHWRGRGLEAEVRRKGEIVRAELARIAARHPSIAFRGIGLIWGLDLMRAGGAAAASRVARRCFERGLIVERCGRNDTVIKLLPPLVIDDLELLTGLEILKAVIDGPDALDHTTPTIRSI